MKSIIFIAPPAAGKGTQSSLVTEKYDYYHISTGDILREEINSGTELGNTIKDIMSSGGLVTDDIVIELVNNKLSSLNGKPFILDGFPRTLAQTEALDKIITGDYVVIYLKLDEDILKKRITGRLTCKCGMSYNIYDEKLKPQAPGVCDKCGSLLIKREDDNEESFIQRYNNFIKSNDSILEFYQNKGVLETIDASKDANIVFEEIEKVIK